MFKYHVVSSITKTLEEKEFNGDIIITDPCYMTIDYEEDFDDFVKMFKEYMVSSTYYGDCGCTVYDTKDNSVIGRFCADAGMVCVVNAEELHKHNPKFDWYETRPHTTTLIKNFKGTVKFVLTTEEYVYDEDLYYDNGKTKYISKGDTGKDNTLIVVGCGINTETGEPLNFFTSQTSL